MAKHVYTPTPGYKPVTAPGAIPRMTTVAKQAIVTPTTGMVVFDTTLNRLSVYDGTTWQTITQSES